MKQVFVEDKCLLNTTLALDDKQAHHIFDVLRTTPRETVRVVSSDSNVYLAHPQQKPFLYVFGREEIEPRLVDVTLCVSLFKSDKFEWMLQKAAELGCSRIVPFISKNSIIRLDPKKIEKKMARWQSILDAACRQSNRNDKVELMPLSILDNLQEYKSRCNLVAYEKEDQSRHLASFLQSNPSSLTCCIGPEGGFDLEEIDLLQEKGFACCSLGNSILRAETACIYVLCAAEYQSHAAPLESEQV